MSEFKLDPPKTLKVETKLESQKKDERKAKTYYNLAEKMVLIFIFILSLYLGFLAKKMELW